MVQRLIRKASARLGERVERLELLHGISSRAASACSAAKSRRRSRLPRGARRRLGGTSSMTMVSTAFASCVLKREQSGREPVANVSVGAGTRRFPFAPGKPSLGRGSRCRRNARRSRGARARDSGYSSSPPYRRKSTRARLTGLVGKRPSAASIRPFRSTVAARWTSEIDALASPPEMTEQRMQMFARTPGERARNRAEPARRRAGSARPGHPGGGPSRRPPDHDGSGAKDRRRTGDALVDGVGVEVESALDEGIEVLPLPRAPAGVARCDEAFSGCAVRLYGSGGPGSRSRDAPPLGRAVHAATIVRSARTRARSSGSTSSLT